MTAPSHEEGAYAHLLEDAVGVLGRWTAPDPVQAQLRRDFLAHLARHPDAVARSGPPAHLTASCLVLDAAGEQVLLTLHRRANAWFQFGGHLEAEDSSLWAAARREAGEESGLDGLEPLAAPVQLDRHALSGAFGRCRVHLDVRAAGDATGDPRMAALEAKADALVALGAERVRRHEPDAEPGSAGWLVMRDPEGNEFCLD